MSKEAHRPDVMDEGERQRLLALAKATGSKDLPLLIKAKVAAAKRVNDNPSDRNMRSFAVASEALEKEVRKLEQGNDSKVLKNVNRARAFLLEQGYEVSYGKLKADLVDRQCAPKRSGGGWTAWALKQYAAAHLSRVVDPSPEADKPTKVGSGDEQQGAGLQRIEAHAEKLRIQAQRDMIKLERERGEVVQIVTVEQELADRAKAFRLGLINYGSTVKEHLATMFGGERETALKLCEALGLEEDSAHVIMDFALKQAQAFALSWPGQVEDFLAPYATGEWWTDEMREAWEAYDTNHPSGG